MKAVVYEDVRTVTVGDVPDPRIEHPADAVVRVTASAICGSDLHFFNGKAPLSPGDTLGHEGVGVIEETGPEVHRFKRGDRVVLAFDVVCGACWFCKRGQTSLCEDFRNLGAGPFGGGLGGTQAEMVRIPNADINLLAIAEKVGAVPINARERNPQMAVSGLTEDRGADVAIEAVGSVPAFETAVEVVRRGGTVSVVGMFVTESLTIPVGVYWSRMLRLQFSGICPIHAWWDRAMAAVARGDIDPLPIISHRLPLAEAVAGYELFDSRRATKVVLQP